MLGICSSTAGDTGLIPGQGTKILHAVWFDQKNNKSKQQLRKKKKKEPLLLAPSLLPIVCT